MNEMEKVPFVVYESAQTRMERIVKRLIIALIIVTAMLFASNIIWLHAWTSYDYEATDEITLDTDGEGNANYIGESGSIVNGENNN